MERKAIRVLRDYEKRARLGGDKEALEYQQARGKLTARQRIEHLVDKDSFVELGMFIQHQCHEFGMESRRPLADGVVTGCAKIDGRKVYLYAQDFASLGGSVGNTHSAKIRYIMDLAIKIKAPVIGLLDSTGARIQEGLSNYSPIFFANTMASGVIPQISVIMGNCAGGSVYSPAITDFIIMVQNISHMFVTGPRVVKEVCSEVVTEEELGGAKVQSSISGVCDLVAHDEDESFRMLRRLLSYLPSSYLQKPPRISSADPEERQEEDLLTIVPTNPMQPFDMHKVITKIVDDGEFFEIKPNFARNIIVGFARLNGYTVGIVANQSLFLAGSLDCDASDKIARFYRFCDCFNIPIISLVDVPGYLPGRDQEHKGIIRHGAKMLYAYAEATVPKIVCIVRKCYGGSGTAMGLKRLGADITLAWPSAEIAVMGPKGAAEIIFRKEIEEAEHPEVTREEKIKEYRELFCSPYHAASTGLVDTVIDPRETRSYLIKALGALQDKTEWREARKHGNIPL